MRNRALLTLLALLFVGCSSQTVPQAHKGRMFDKTGWLAFYAGGRGFEGPVLGPGTYYTGVYPEVRMVDCTRRTIKEPLSALAKDGVQFSLDIYISFSANCDDEAAVKKILSDLAPLGEEAQREKTSAHDKDAGAASGDQDPIELNPDLTVTSRQLYDTYVLPALGESVRATVAHFNANDVNQKRDDLFKQISDKLGTDINKGSKVALVTVYSLNLSNFAFPKEMADANTDRATQAVLRDTAVAAREKVKAETETAVMRVQQAQAEAQADAAKIDTIGAALHRNPEYYLRDVYAEAGQKGGLVVLPQNPGAVLQITPPRPSK
jgi:hypothetical protein